MAGAPRSANTLHGRARPTDLELCPWRGGPERQQHCPCLRPRQRGRPPPVPAAAAPEAARHRLQRRSESTESGRATRGRAEGKNDAGARALEGSDSRAKGEGSVKAWAACEAHRVWRELRERREKHGAEEEALSRCARPLPFPTDARGEGTGAGRSVRAGVCRSRVRHFVPRSEDGERASPIGIVRLSSRRRKTENRRSLSLHSPISHPLSIERDVTVTPHTNRMCASCGSAAGGVARHHKCHSSVSPGVLLLAPLFPPCCTQPLSPLPVAAGASSAAFAVPHAPSPASRSGREGPPWRFRKWWPLTSTRRCGCRRCTSSTAVRHAAGRGLRPSRAPKERANERGDCGWRPARKSTVLVLLQCAVLDLAALPLWRALRLAPHHHCHCTSPLTSATDLPPSLLPSPQRRSGGTTGRGGSRTGRARRCRWRRTPTRRCTRC